MNIIRTNLKIERNQLIKGILTWVPAIQNGYMAAAGILHEIDRTVFKKTKEEKDLLLTLKERNKAERRKEFGSNYKRHLNSSANSVTFPERWTLHLLNLQRCQEFIPAKAIRSTFALIVSRTKIKPKMNMQHLAMVRMIVETVSDTMKNILRMKMLITDVRLVKNC